MKEQLLQKQKHLPVTGKPLCFFAGERKALKSIFNTNNELSQNHAANRVIPFKTTVNWLFNDLKISSQA